MDNRRKSALYIAAGFFVFWLAVLYAGADHPPPPGFTLVVILCLGSSMVVYFRSTTYIDWIKQKKERRFLHVFMDGIIAGLVIAVITLLLPGGAEPGIPTPGLLEHIIWFSILALVGTINSMVVYAFTAFLTKKYYLKGDKQ